MRQKTSNKLTHIARNMGRLDTRGVLRELGSIRAELKPNAYASFLRAMDISAPKHRSIFDQKPLMYGDLAFRGPMQPVSLENELAWASTILPRMKGTIDAHSTLLAELQELFAAGRFEDMSSVLDSHNEHCGWSYWAADLLFAITAKQDGTPGVRKLAAELQRGAANRPSSLYATILIDRTDDSLSYSEFLAKADRSFPRFEPDWFRTYIKYRATNTVEDPEQGFPVILSIELKSSSVDYFESLLDCLTTINEDERLASRWDCAKSLIEAMLTSGFNDWRVRKLAEAFGCEFESPTSSDYNSPLRRLEVGMLGVHVEGPPDSTRFEKETLKRLMEVQAKELFNLDESDDLIKAGINFKSLPISFNLALTAVRGSNADFNSRVLDLNVTFISIYAELDHWLAFRDDLVLANIKRHCIEGVDGELNQQILRWVNAVLEDGFKSNAEVPRSLFVAWLAKYLVKSRRHEDAYSLCIAMDSLGAPWSKLSAKLKIHIAKEGYELSSALTHAAEKLIQDYRYAYDLPLERIFEGQSWADFKSLDPALVALVAHYANSLSSDGNTRFICRMACRQFFKTGGRGKIEELWSSLDSHFDRAVIIAFLEDAWTEENLVLIEDFKSTHDVRRERLELFQQLLIWNPESEQEYSEYIKQLTLDETLWRGLQHLDETRIFVNEAAISRWAEKELLPSFERWRSLSGGADTSVLQDELIRNYLVNPSVDNLIKALPLDCATEGNAVLLDIIDRMFKRFVTDPADGLESYLSLRIRHGTLRGTLLGPLEQEGLLISGEASEEAFHRRWDHVLRLPQESMAPVIDALRVFSRQVQDEVRSLIDERVQVFSSAKPQGAFPTAIDGSSARIVLSLFSAEMSFSAFLATCYLLFWTMIQPARVALADHINGYVKVELQANFERLSVELADDPRLVPLIGALRAAATSVQNQCDLAAGWFTRESDSEAQSYPLSVAIEIAKRATNNVYRKFSGDLSVDEGNATELHLSANGLAVLYDCLYVVFENAWKHSGLGDELGPIRVTASFCTERRILELVIENDLSRGRVAEMVGARLTELRLKYLKALPVDLVAREGGSGFAKLARAVQMVDRKLCPQPLDFGIREDKWYVKIDIPLYERNSRYDAYE